MASPYRVENIRARLLFSLLVSNSKYKINYSRFKECWKRGYKAINIHDAVIILDCPENATVSNYEVEKVMMDVYEAHGLRPTIKTDVYQ